MSGIRDLAAGVQIGNTLTAPILQAIMQKKQNEREDARYADEKQYKNAMLDIARQKASTRSPLTSLSIDSKIAEQVEREMKDAPQEIKNQRAQEIKAQYGFSDAAPQIPSQPAQSLQSSIDPNLVKQAGDATQVTGTIPGTDFKIKTNATNAHILSQTPQGKALLGSTQQDAGALSEGVPSVPTPQQSSQQADSLAQGSPTVPNADEMIKKMLQERAIGTLASKMQTSAPKADTTMQDLAISKAQPQDIDPKSIDQYGKGNIDLYNRPHVQNADGSTSTVKSKSFNIGGEEILIPTVAADGSKILSDREAIDQYRKTGQYLGKFKTPEEATSYAIALHKQQEGLLPNGSPTVEANGEVQKPSDWSKMSASQKYAWNKENGEPTSELTAEQAKTASVLERMMGSEGRLSAFLNEYKNRPENKDHDEYGTTITNGGIPNTLDSGIPFTDASRFLPESFKPNDYKDLDYNSRNWLSGLLRKDSGASINNTEWKLGDLYFPRPGDDSRIVADKASARKEIVKGLIESLPEDRRKKFMKQYSKAYGNLDSKKEEPKATQDTGGYKQGKQYGNLIFKGGDPKDQSNWIPAK